MAGERAMLLETRAVTSAYQLNKILRVVDGDEPDI